MHALFGKLIQMVLSNDFQSIVNC